jgi:short-subunit dehydrogenase
MNKLIVVTGGSKGIGQAIITLFASKGFDIATCSRNGESLQRLKEETELSFPNVKVHYITADLSEKQDVKEFITFVQGLNRPIEILVNNVGIFIPGQIHQEDDKVFETMMATNLNSAYYITKGLINSFISRKAGHIFNICSTASITPYVNGGSYCISKYALYGMTKVLREEMKQYGVKVTAVLPGATFTSSWEGVNLPLSRFIPSHDIAQAILSNYSMSPSTVVEEILIRPQAGDIGAEEQ